MAGIFISYRHDDRPGYAGRLADALENAFGENCVFRDVEDIRPGEDFVVAIQTQLSNVNVMLVVIGPNWLTASRDGARRLDDPDDFVRREIHAALEAGKSVLPVLVDGALMPGQSDLPKAIENMARRQAFVLTDSGWTSDVARLIEHIRALLPIRKAFPLNKRTMWRLIAGVAIVAILVFAAFATMKLSAVPSSTPTESSSPGTDRLLNGRWRAQVKYDWGDVHEETFDLRVENDEIHGTASYLKLARTIEQGQLWDTHLSFVTRSLDQMGDAAPREQTHRYRGELKSGELHLTLESSGGLSTHVPVDFIARHLP